MSTTGLPSSGDKQTKGWRTKSVSRKGRRHRWQMQGEFADRRFFRRSRRRKLLLGGVLAAILGSLGLFAYLILFAPRKVPVLTMVAMDYSWPYRPNSWAKEDLDRLKALDGRSIRIHSVGQDQMRRPEWLADFRRSLANVEEQHGPKQPLVIYISMHGAVDASGTAYLIPPNSSPIDSATWIPVADILEMIRRVNLEGEHPIVLFLDCNKTLSNWDRGLIYNTFPEAVGYAISEARIPRLFVLNSTSMGERAGTSELIRGSIFGESVGLALAGAADQLQNGGNADSRVQLSEIVDFVGKRVNDWSIRSRGRPQTPTIFPRNGPNVEISWAVPNLQPSGPPVAPDIETQRKRTIEAIFELWSAYEDLPRVEVLRLQPHAATRFIQELEWCEQAVVAGQFYLPRIESKLEQLRHNLRSIQSQLGKSGRADDDFFWGRKPGPTGHTLPLNRYFGKHNAASAELASRVGELSTDFSAAKLSELLDSDRPEWNRFVDFRFLKIMRDMETGEQLSNRALIQQALSTQLRFRQASIPSDLRLFPLMKRTLTDLNQQRRMLEDKLLVGSSQRDDWTAFEKSIDTAQTEIDELAGHLELSDRALHQAPLLARWIADPIHHGEVFRKHLEYAGSHLSPIFQNSQLLADSLAGEESAQPGDKRARMRSTARELRDVFSMLRKAWRAEAVFESTDVAWNVRDIDTNQSILRVPILFDRSPTENLSGTEQRKALFENTRKMREHFERTQVAQANDTSIGPESSDASHFDSIRSLLTTAGNLVLEMIAVKQDREELTLLFDSASSVEYFQAYVYGTLSTFPKDNQKLLADAGSRASGSRPLLHRAAIDSRKLASFWKPAASTAAIEELAQFDRTRFVQTQLETVLDDFLGDRSLIDPPFFQQAASAYFRYFDNEETGDVELAMNHKRLEELRRSRLAALERGLKLTSSTNVFLDGQLFAPIELQLQPGDPAAFSALPNMTGQLFVEDDRQRRSSTYTKQVDPAESAVALQEPARIPSETIVRADFDPTLRGTFLYRGHAISTPFQLTMPKGPTTTISQSHPSQAEVTVIDSDAKPVSVMLVLDCSQSMNNLIPWETADKKLTRFDAAVLATNRILQSLATMPEARVGLILYGHRVGWNTAQPNQLLRQSTYQNDIPDSLKPYEDVETVLPFGRFGKIEHGKIRELLKTVKPWGETPLYLSIRTALREMRAKSRGRKRQIIVITDGLNQQLNPAPDRFVSLNTLLTEDFKDTTVNIVGFGIESADSASAAAEFGRVARHTGGSYAEVNDAGPLLQQLTRYFSKRDFTVETNRAIRKQQAGVPLSFDVSPKETRNALIKFANYQSRLELTAGDGYQLILDEQGRRLKSVKYLQRDPVFQQLTNSIGPSEYQLGVHRPALREGKLQVELSIQHSDQQPTIRPAAYYVEIQPLMKDKRESTDDRTFVATGSSFVPGKPVPVVNLEIANWPVDAIAARITAAVRFDPLPVDKFVSLQQMSQRPDLKVIDSRLSNSSPDTLIVVRKYPSAMLLVDQSPLLKLTTTEIDRQHNVVINRFVFTQPLNRVQLDGLRFYSFEPDKNVWIDNNRSPLDVPIDVNQPLQPVRKPIQLR